MPEKDDAWYMKLLEASKPQASIIDIHALFIFSHKDTGRSPLELLALCGQNLIAFLITKIHQKYPVIEMDQLDTSVSNYLQKVENFISMHDNLKLFIFAPHRNSTAPIDMQRIFAQIRKFPRPIPSCGDQINDIYHFVSGIISSSTLPESEQWHMLYELSSEWIIQLLASKSQLLSSKDTRDLLHLGINRSKTKNQKLYQNSIIWGAEFDFYYRAYLAKGFKNMAARGMARKQFANNHPYPQDDNELLSSTNIPGLTAPAVRRYHQIYLSVTGNIESENNQ